MGVSFPLGGSLAERLVISVDPGTTELSQKVQDVFGHVLDLFDLLTHSGQIDDDAVAWRLVSVSMNSPLTIVAEAIASRSSPSVNVERVARTQRERFSSNISELKRGRVPDVWRGPREVKRISRAFNASQPATTRVMVPDDGKQLESVVVLPLDLPAVEQALRVAAAEAVPRPKEQRGSIEGQIVEVGTFYNRPAIRIRERKSRAEVWCTVTEAHREQVSGETNFEDVWNGRRVLIEGVLQYDSSGLLSRVFVDTVHVTEPREVPVEVLGDPKFTQGLSAVDYLERFREGTLG
jgi:hypothetical protein